MISQRFAQALKAKRPDLFARISPKIWKKEWFSLSDGVDQVVKGEARDRSDK